MRKPQKDFFNERNSKKQTILAHTDDAGDTDSERSAELFLRVRAQTPADVGIFCDMYGRILEDTLCPALLPQL